VPNWCSNTLIITGPKADIDQFVNITKNPETDDPDAQRYTIASRFLPFPKGFEKTETVTMNDGTVLTFGVLSDEGWKWQHDNWGVKWGDCHTMVTDRQDNKVTYLFNTPWGPMLPAINNISKMFPTLSFVVTWSEDGMQFMGAASFVNGECLFKSDIEGEAYPQCYDWNDPEAVDAFLEQGANLIDSLRAAALESVA